MKKEAKTLHDHFRIIENLLFIGFIIMIIPAVIPMQARWTGVLLFLGFGVMVAACIYRNRHFKCPHCGGKLNVRGVPKYCPDCGRELS